MNAQVPDEPSSSAMPPPAVQPELPAAPRVLQRVMVLNLWANKYGSEPRAFLEKRTLPDWQEYRQGLLRDVRRKNRTQRGQGQRR